MAKTRFGFWGVTLGLFSLVVIVVLNSSHAQRTIAADANETKLHRLLTEKAAVLKEDVDHLEELHVQGQAGFEELFAAHVALYRARLDLCDSDESRIEVLEKLLTEAKRREEAVAALGTVSSTLLKHKAQVDRLDVEIQLERLKAK